MQQNSLSPREPGLDRYFIHLYEYYYEPMLAFAYSMLQDEMEAEDCVCEAFLRVKQANQLFASISNARNYLFIVVRNQTLKALKEKKIRDAYRRDAIAPPPSYSGIERFLNDSLDIREHIEQVLASLTPSQRKIIEMSFLEGMSVKEIAQKLGRTVNGVAAEKSKALRKLKNINRDLRILMPLFLTTLLQLKYPNFF